MTDGAFRIKEGDTLPALRLILLGGDGLPLALGDSDTVTFRMTPVEPGIADDVAAAATVNDAAKGDVQYGWPGGAPPAGLYRAEFHVAFSGGGSQTFPSGDEYLSVLVGRPAQA